MSENVLQEAQRLTSSDRQGQYGHPSEHFARTVAALNARFGTGSEPLFAREMEACEWPLMVLIDKACGRGNETREIKRDSLVDICGYARTVEMVQELEHEKEQDVKPKRIYIAGPMRGIKLYNFPEFDKARDMFCECEYQGDEFDPVSPADLDRAEGFDPANLPSGHDWNAIPPGFDFARCRKRDIEALESCDAIYLLRGWANSVGAQAEYAYARWCGKQVLEQE